MKTYRLCLSLLALLAVGSLVGCSGTSTMSPEVSDSIRQSLDEAGLKHVSVSQDRDKGVVTLSGDVATVGDKAQAESIAKSIATGQVVANQIAVIPPGVESDAKTVNSDLDKGIDNNLHAALIQNRLTQGVQYDVKNGVVTLSGEVNSQSKRAQVEEVASAVPNVLQVVNELQVKDQKASSSTDSRFLGQPTRSTARSTTVGAYKTISSGTELSLRTNDAIDSKTATAGQKFSAVMYQDVLDNSGALAISKGSDAELVIRSTAGGSVTKTSSLVLDVDTITVAGKRYVVSTGDVQQKGRQGLGANKRTAEMVGGGAAIGALIGAIAGKGKGAAIGAGVGAAAGAGAQVLTKGDQVRVPAETVLTFKLERDLRLEPAR